VKGYEDQLNATLGQVIGQTQVELDAMQATSRSRETNLGDFIADAYRTRLGADVALLNGGGIRSNTTYPVGPLTRKDVLSVLPFSDPSVKLEVSGKMLKEALENGVSRLEEKEAGRFPQVSGLRFQYDGRKPTGSRVVNVIINGQPLNGNKLYSLATSSYLQGGGDDYLMFKSAKVLLKPEETPLDADIVQGAIEQAKIIAPKVDGRIQRLDPQ
jgi:2',3'-cyclic-nucleotide 2'-phosphodiesterase (5'-nucleotidase family)